MNQSNERHNSICIFIMMSLTILVTSTAFISWYYKIASLYPSKITDFTAEVLVYVIHILGMMLFSLGLKRNPNLVLNKKSYIFCICLWFFMSLISVSTDLIPVVMGFGLIASLLTGHLFGYYLTGLALKTKQRRGLLFGGAGAVTSIVSFLISLPMHGSFLAQPSVWILYTIFVLISVLCAWFLFPEKENAVSEELSDPAVIAIKEPGKVRTYFIFCAVTIVLLSMVGNMGFYFPSADITQAGVNLEFSRAFYSIGLIIAGLVYDKSPKTALILCSTTVLFPVVSLLLMEQIHASAVIWVMAYIILGFVSVSRALSFVVPAGSTPKLLYLAPFGFAFGRLGEALGVSAGILLTPYHLSHVIATSVVCVLTLFAIFLLFDLGLQNDVRQMVTAGITKSKDECADSLSYREQEVLQMLLNGKTYREIASELFISENTVKFHVKNIYKKYGCSSRKELIQKYRS